MFKFCEDFIIHFDEYQIKRDWIFKYLIRNLKALNFIFGANDKFNYGSDSFQKTQYNSYSDL